MELTLREALEGMLARYNAAVESGQHVPQVGLTLREALESRLASYQAEVESGQHVPPVVEADQDADEPPEDPQ
jgi:hypothetical protein